MKNFSFAHLTRYLWQKANLRILVVVDDKYTKMRRHHRTAGALARCEDLCINDARIARLLAHAELVQILAKNIVDQHDTIVLHAEQLFGIAPAHCEKLTRIPLCK